jgi:hypothetical protein
MARPKLNVDILEIIGLRWAGYSWREISSQTGLGYGTVCRAYRTAISLLQVSQNPKARHGVKRVARTNTGWPPSSENLTSTTPSCRATPAPH